jgi:hypothetical protein
MADDDSVKALLEKLCSLQEQQLTKLTELAERSAKAHEKIEKMQDLWRQTLAKYEETQKKALARATGQVIGVWVRAALTAFMLALIALAIIVAHYLK